MLALRTESKGMVMIRCDGDLFMSDVGDEIA